MPEPVITIPLNQQQIELLDRTVAAGHAPDRQSLFRLAIREYLSRHTSLGNSPAAPATSATPAGKA